jgi:histidine triad (HIT) family protein
MPKTIFKKIIDGEIPSTKVYEDEKVIAFLDIQPVAPGHTLIIPKKEYEWVQDLPDELLSYLFVTAKKIMKAIKEGLGCDYVQISVVGKDIPHAHVHLIPRYFNDGLHGWPTTTYKEGEADAVAEKIKSCV